MSLQRIINSAESISINRRRMIGVQYSKSQIATTVETVTRNPWQFKVKFSAVLPFEDDNTRSIIETIDTLDRNRFESGITFSDNPKLSWMLKYKGDLLPNQIAAFSVRSFAGTTLSLYNNFNGLNPGIYLFRAGDYVQIVGKPFPFTVRTNIVLTTEMIINGYVDITVHRGNFIVDSVVGDAINVGNAVEFQMFCPNMPTYTIIPGGNTALVEFDSDFQLYEWTGTEI